MGKFSEDNRDQGAGRTVTSAECHAGRDRWTAELTRARSASGRAPARATKSSAFAGTSWCAVARYSLAGSLFASGNAPSVLDYADHGRIRTDQVEGGIIIRRLRASRGQDFGFGYDPEPAGIADMEGRERRDGFDVQLTPVGMRIGPASDQCG